MRLRRCHGFVLVTTALAMIGMLALVGLAVDVGRLYIARGELQVFADESAVAAAFELDGTSAGITRATNISLTGPLAGTTRNRWNFSTQTVSNVTVQFSTSPSGTFSSTVASPAGVRFVRVQISATVPLYFLPVVPGVGDTRTVRVAAVGGQDPSTSLGDGLSPFTPTAHNTQDPNYGFQAGLLYTLRWAPSGNRNKPGGSCSGDVGFDPGSSSERGYVDVGQGTGASAVRDAVVNNNFYLPAPITIGSTLNMLTGQQSVPTAVQERFSQDTDATATNYANYKGNGRRLLVTAVNGGGDPAVVIGFAVFFLQPTPCGTSNTTPCCAEYVGASLIAGTHKGAGAPGLYEVQLVE